MRYIAVAETDWNPDFCIFQEMLIYGNVLVPHTIGQTKVRKAPEPMENYEAGSFQDGYNQALRDCGVLKDED